MVFKRYARILDDPRHSDCRLITISRCQQRMLETWTMGHIPGEALSLEEMAEIYLFQRQSVEPSQLIRVLRRFYDCLKQNQPAAQTS